MTVRSDPPPLADSVTKLAGIAGFAEPLEMRVIIRQTTTTASIARKSKQSSHLDTGEQLPYVHNATNCLTELNMRRLERLAYWRNGREGAKNHLLNQAITEYLDQHQESNWPIPTDCLAQLHVDVFPKVTTQNESEPCARRSQRDYSLHFKLAVVGGVGRGDLGYKQAQQRCGIQGRTAVQNLCRRYATHFAASQAVGPTYSGATLP